MSQIVDFNEKRAEKLEDKRRKTERIFFNQLMGVYSVTGGDQMSPVELIEVSDHGLSFQVPFSKDAKPWPNDMNQDIPIRLYFSQDTYLLVIAKIQNSTSKIENGVRFMRYGCAIDEKIASYDAYLQFVRFLKAYSEQAHKDMGEVSVFYL